MRKHHPDNERIKRRHFQFLRDAKQLSEASVDKAAAAISAFEASTGYRDFKRFHIEQARKFKRDLADQINPATGKPLAKATIRSRLLALRTFVLWLADQPGYRSGVRYSDAEYFNLSANDTRIARAVRERPVPSIEQIRHVLSIMPMKTDIQLRDRALIAFTLLSGARDNAIASMSLKHVDVERRLVHQDAREVRTKRAKTFTSSFFPVGGDIETNVIEWIRHLRANLLFGDDDPLFPATRVGLNEAVVFEATGLEHQHWKNASSIRRIFREAFELAGLPAFNPHSFRHTLARLGEKSCHTPEEFKAWSQNLGHEQVLTTFNSYGKVSGHRQAEIMDGLCRQVTFETSDDEAFTKIEELLRSVRHRIR